MSLFTRTLFVLLACTGLFLGGVGCDNTEEDPALLRVVHATPGSDALDFFIDFELFTRGLGFRSASPYLRWDPGLRRLEVRPANGQGDAVTQEELIQEGQAYTILALGSSTVSSLFLTEDDRSTPPAGQARLRVVHAAPGLGALNVLIREENDPGGIDVNLSTSGSLSSSFSIAAGPYVIEAREISGAGAPAIITQNLDPGVRYLVVVTNTVTFVIADG